MKKIISLLLIVVCFQNISVAQEYSSESSSGDTSSIRYYTPTFLDIPIDGTKDWFENQLIEKRGFVKDDEGELHGKFMDKDVELLIFDNEDKLVFNVRVVFPEMQTPHAFVKRHNELVTELYLSGEYEYLRGDIIEGADLASIINNPANIGDSGEVMTIMDVFTYPNRIENGVTYIASGRVYIQLLYLSAEAFNNQYDQYGLFLNYSNYDNWMNDADVNQ